MKELKLTTNIQVCAYSELVEAYQLEAAVAERTAKNHVKEAKDNNFIVVQNGLYSLAPK